MTTILKCDDCGLYSDDYALLSQECPGTMREADKPYPEWVEACKDCCHYATALANEDCIRGAKMRGKYCMEV